MDPPPRLALVPARPAGCRPADGHPRHLRGERRAARHGRATWASLGGDIGWTITSYSLIFGSLLLLGGRAADLLGRRRVFLAGLAVFTARVARLGAGGRRGHALRRARGSGPRRGDALAGGAVDHHDARSRAASAAQALGAWGAVGGAGAAIGVLLGGALTELVDWRAIFLINLPVGLVARGRRARRIVPADAGASAVARARPARRRCSRPPASARSSTRSPRPPTRAGLRRRRSASAAPGWPGSPLFARARAAHRAAAAARRSGSPTARVGGGFVMMLAASAVLFGTFLLSSLYLQNVLGHRPARDRAGVPAARRRRWRGGAHVGSHVIGHARRPRCRWPRASPSPSAGLLLLSGVDAGGSYVADVLPGMLIAGVGLGVVLVCVAVSVLTGARDEETGMLSGLNTTGHEIGGSLGVAVLATIAAGAIGAGRAAAARSRRHQRRVPGRGASSPARPALLALRGPALGAQLPAQAAARAPPSCPSTRHDAAPPARHQPPTAAPPRRRRAQRRPDPRRGPRRAGGRSRGEHGRDRPPGGRGAGDDLRPLPDARVPDRRRDRPRDRRGHAR